MNERGIVTFEDIAKKAGVSKSTVSLALRNDHRLPSATCARIQKVADELGYRSNPLVSALMSHQRSAKKTPQNLTIAFLTSFHGPDVWRSDTIFREFFEGAHESAQRHGYNLEPFWTLEKGMTGERVTKILLSRNIPGLLVCPMPASRAHMKLDWQHFSAVAFGHTLQSPNLHRVVNHQYRAVRMIVRELLNRKIQRVGLVISPRINNRCDQNWTAGFNEEESLLDKKERIPLCLATHTKEGKAAFEKWFRKWKPEAIIGHRAMPLVWLKEMGVSVPGDVAYADCDVDKSQGDITGVYQNGRLVGSTAFDWLMGMLHRNERGIPEHAHTILVDGKWVEGRTL